MSQWELKQVSPDSPEWTRILSENKSLLFHQPVWARVVEEGFNGKACCLILEKDGRVTGGMMGFTHRVLWARFLLFNFPYGGVIGRVPQDGRLAVLLTEFVRKHRIARVRLVDNPNLDVVPPAGFTVIPNTTHMLEINGRQYDEIWLDYRKKIRRDVRKAEKSGVTIEEAADDTGLVTFYSLYLESMSRNQALAKYSLKLVRAIHSLLVPNGTSALFLAYREGRAIAGILVVDSESISHYLLAGSRTEDLKYGANDLLISEAIRRAADKGLDYFDFLPSGPDDPALVRFKTKWGAVPFNVHTLDLVVRPLSTALFNQASRLANTRPARLLVKAVSGHARSS